MIGIYLQTGFQLRSHLRSQWNCWPIEHF